MRETKFPSALLFLFLRFIILQESFPPFNPNDFMLSFIVLIKIQKCVKNEVDFKKIQSRKKKKQNKTKLTPSFFPALSCPNFTKSKNNKTKTRKNTNVNNKQTISNVFKSLYLEQVSQFDLLKLRPKVLIFQSKNKSKSTYPFATLWPMPNLTWTQGPKLPSVNTRSRSRLSCILTWLIMIGLAYLNHLQLFLKY